MLLSELKPEQVYPGLKVLSKTGKILTVMDFRSSPHNVSPVQELVNNCVNIKDDGWVWLQDEDNHYHGWYLNQYDLIILES